jgi:hypothetical protein
LNESQRAIIAADIANLEKGANQHTIEGGSIDLPSAAKMLNVGEASVKRAKNVLTKAAPEIVEKVRQGKIRVSSVSKKVLVKPQNEQVKALEEEEQRKSDNATKTSTADDAYSKVEKKLIEKLQELKPNEADAAATETIKKLKATVATMLKVVASAQAA